MPIFEVVQRGAIALLVNLVNLAVWPAQIHIGFIASKSNREISNERLGDEVSRGPAYRGD